MMKTVRVPVTEIKVGDVFKLGSLRKVIAVSAPFVCGYGEDGHFYRAESVRIDYESSFDYDPEHKNLRSTIIPTEGFLYKVISGETITKTKFSGVWSNEAMAYL